MKNRHVMRSAALVGACTGVSRLLGLLRNVLMAATFGTSLAGSAFVVAFCIPNLFRRLFGEGALSAAFVPIFTESLHKEGRESAWKLAGAVMSLLAAVLTAVVVITVAGIAGSLAYLPVSERMEMVLRLTRIMFPYMWFICLVALCMAILNSFRHFAVPALTPVLLNVVWIGMLLVVCPRVGGSLETQVVALAWGIVAAGGLQLAVQIPILVRHGFRFHLSAPWRDARVRRVLILMGPAALGMGVFQINVIVDKMLALWVAEWAPAALFYAEMLVYLPLGLFATALGTVLLPTFSSQAATLDHGAIRDTLNHALRMLILLMVPAATGLLVLARPIVALLYQWQGGAFDAASLTQTTRALAFYAPGLVVFSVYKALVPAFYAMQDTATPVRIGVRMVFLNLFLNIAFVLTWPDGYEHAGLACATVLASAANGVCLAVILRKRIGPIGWPVIARSLLRSLAAAVLMGVSAVAVLGFIRGLDVPLHAKIVDMAAVLGAVLTGIGIYVAAAAVIARHDVRELRDSLRR